MFGIGRLTKIPGTLASFVTCLIYYILMSNLIPFTISLEVYCLILCILFFIAVALIDECSENFKQEDSKEIVIDEFIGQSIPIIFLSFYALPFLKWKGIVLGWEKLNYPLFEPKYIFLLFICFILFRFFDILKPFPINLIDKKMKNSWGVVLDDVVAGIYATLSGYYIVIPLFFE